MKKEILKPIYNTVLSQTISSDGNYLFCGNNFGEILIFNIPKIVCHLDSSENAEESIQFSNLPIGKFVASEKDQIHSLAFYKDFLIVGTVGAITGYLWNTKTHTIMKTAWRIEVPINPEMLEKGEINYMWLDRDKGHLYAGCGDNNVYGINLEDGKVFATFKAHTNYVHCIDGSDNRLVSASEDGTVKFWDLRSNQATQSITPSQNEKLNRPEYGKWIGTVSLNEDWLLLGGGPRASLWHTRSLESTAFTFPERVHVSGFLDDNIMFGGDSKTLYHFNYSGQVTSEIPVSSSVVYSVVWQTDNNKLMAIGGASNEVDICTNFGYKDLVLSCYEKKTAL